MNYVGKNFGLKLLVTVMMAAFISACTGGDKSTASNSASKGKEPVSAAVKDSSKGADGQQVTDSDKATKKDANPNTEIYLYKGPDRDKKLIEKAKEEGGVTLYTGMNPEDAAPFIEGFEKKYGIKITMWRANGEEVTTRMINEAKAKRYDADIVEAASTELEKLAREGLLNEFYSPYFEDMAEMPSHKKWAPTRLNFYVMAWNTQKVKPEDVPKTYEDLLDAKWKGNFVIESKDQVWFANVVKQMGEQKGLEFFKKMSQNDPVIRSGHTLISQLIVAGEAPLSLTVYNHQAEKLKSKKAPIDWRPLQPMVGEPLGVGVAVHAKHPYAALLFADFMMSPDGQKIVEKLGRVPSSKKVSSDLNNFKYKMADPTVVLDEWAKWDKLWEDLFIKAK